MKHCGCSAPDRAETRTFFHVLHRSDPMSFSRESNPCSVESRQWSSGGTWTHTLLQRIEPVLYFRDPDQLFCCRESNPYSPARTRTRVLLYWLQSLLFWRHSNPCSYTCARTYVLPQGLEPIFLCKDLNPCSSVAFETYPCNGTRTHVLLQGFEPIFYCRDTNPRPSAGNQTVLSTRARIHFRSLYVTFHLPVTAVLTAALQRSVYFSAYHHNHIGKQSRPPGWSWHKLLPITQMTTVGTWL